MSDDSDHPGATAAGAEPACDLLGDPPAPYRDPRGRKKPHINSALRERVAVLRASGMSREEIAQALGWCERTLRTYFLPELTAGRHAKRAEIIMRLYDMAMAGSVPAMKAFLAMTAEKGAPATARPVKLGKKEQALLDATSAPEGGRWGGLLEGPVH